MARRADWDTDNFEIIYDTSSMKIQDKFETIDDNDFDILPCSNESPPLTNTNHTVQVLPVPSIVKKPVSDSIEIDKKPIVAETKSSFENSFNRSPLRYGTAANIPYQESFDLKSVLNSKPILPSNDLMSLLRDDKLQKHGSMTNNFTELLMNHTRDHENLLQISKQIQQDFLNAIELD